LTAFRSEYSNTLSAFFSIKNVYIHRHSSTIGVCGNAYYIESLYADNRTTGDDNYALILENNSNRSEPAVARNIKLMNLGGLSAKAIDFESDYATLENVFLWRYGSDSGSAVRFSGRMSKVSNVYLSGNSVSSSSGFEYSNPYRGRTDSVEVTGFSNGTGVIGSGVNLIATNCISVSNGTATTLASANLVANCRTGFGNFTWSV